MPRYYGAGNMMNKVLKSIFNKEDLKSRIPYALLGGFTPSLMFLFFGVLDIYAGNRDEFMFVALDFVPYIALIAFAASVLLSLLILILPKPASTAVFGVTAWLSVTGYLQALLLNGSNSLGGDTGEKTGVALLVIDAAVWIVTGAVIIFGAFMMQKKDILKRIYLIGLVVILVMNVTGCVTRTGDITRSRNDTMAETEAPDSTDDVTADTDTEAVTTDTETVVEKTPDVTDPSEAYLTKKGLDQVSTGKNIVIFLVDRFDVSYYQDIINGDPGFFDELDGFTYFSDNVSLYSRTWPAVPTMITGVDNDFSVTANEYFTKAYTQSPFLNDLKANDYAIKLYTAGYYCYRDGTPLIGLADNISESKGYTITDRGALVGNMLKLSAYRYAPNLVKDNIDIATSSFSGIVELNGSAPLFEVDDPIVCSQILENGLSFDHEGNSYIFIHLNGGHSPYNMDEELNRTKNSSAIKQIRGNFKMIKYYLSEMKHLGVYDDATIIITGDHPRARDDGKIPEEPRLTALFVKTAGSTGALKYSDAQVSQENLIPTLVKSAGIKTDVDYGLSYFEVEEGTDVVRYHKFQLSAKDQPSEIVTFKVTGKGDDFSNWQIEDRHQLTGSFYR